MSNPRFIQEIPNIQGTQDKKLRAALSQALTLVLSNLGAKPPRSKSLHLICHDTYLLWHVWYIIWYAVTIIMHNVLVSSLEDNARISKNTRFQPREEPMLQQGPVIVSCGEGSLSVKRAILILGEIYISSPPWDNNTSDVIQFHIVLM